MVRSGTLTSTVLPLVIVAGAFVALVAQAFAPATDLAPLGKTAAPGASGATESPAEPPPLDERATPGEVDTYFEGRIAPYPKVDYQKLGDSVVANGVPMRVGWGFTPDPVNVVLEFYARDFRRQGLEPQRRELDEGMAMVSAVDGKAGRVLSVTAVARPDGLTELRPTVADIQNGTFDFGAPSDVPLVPGSGAIFTTESREGGRHTRTVQSVNWATVEEIQSYYRRELTKRGWTTASEGSPASHLGPRTLSYVRPDGSTLDVHLQPLTGERGSSVYIIFSVPAGSGAPR